MDVFLIFVSIYVILAIVLLCIKKNISRFALKMLGNLRWFLDVAMPIGATILLTILFNLLMYYSNTNENGNEQLYFFGMIIHAKNWMIVFAMNAMFAILTFFLALELQRYFVQALFSRHYINAARKITNEFFILQAFVLKIYNQTISTPNFFRHCYCQVNGNFEICFSNISELIDNIKGGGVKLSTYLYAVLLQESLLQKPSCLYSVWDTRIVDINNNSDYRQYTESLSKIYTKLTDKDKKIRIFISESDNFATTFPETLKNKHKEWGFEKIYYCTSAVFQTIKTDANMHESYDDFIVFESKKTKWIIGKDYQDRKTRISNDTDLTNNMTKCFTEHLSQCKEMIL